jgi:hypothetical protein
MKYARCVHEGAARECTEAGDAAGALRLTLYAELMRLEINSQLESCRKVGLRPENRIGLGKPRLKIRKT